MPEPTAAGHASSLQVTECDFVELKDGTRLEILADSIDPAQTCLAVWKKGSVRFTRRLEQDGHAFVGLPQSGKTTLLRVLNLVYRRSLLIADITSATFYRFCARFMPTMLIDETATVANDRALRNILRTGTTRDVVAVRRNHTFHSYGAKVISWLEQPNVLALNSRCILIPMFGSKSTALLRTEEPHVQQVAADLQAQLLQFRFENYKRVQPAPVSGDEILRLQIRDLLRSHTAAHVDPERSQRLLRFFESGQCISVEPLSPEHNASDLRVSESALHEGSSVC